MAIRLYLQNEATNKNRFYTIQVQPDLFGCYSVIREWGRLDNKGGKIRITPALTETQAHRVACLLYTSPSPRDKRQSRMPSSA